MQRWCVTICVVCVAGSMAAGQSLYTAICRDGRVVSGPRLDARREVDRLFRLGSVELFSGGTPPMLVRNNSVRPALKPPYIRLINGDVLTGNVVRCEPSNGLREESVLWVNRGQDGEVPVRVSWVESIVSGSGRIAPAGSLIDAKGEVVPFTACRFVPEGIRVLSEGQVRKIAFGALSQVDLPVSDRVGKILQEAAFSRAMGTRWMSRVTLADGSIMTGRRKEVAMDHNRSGFVQPVWADRRIPVQVSKWAWWSFHEVDEIPLTLLAATELERKTMTGFVWRWRKGESLRGGVLASGKYIADTGLAMHSRTALSFKLPDGTRSVSMWVGLDRDVQEKGCATVALRRDSATGAALWERRFMTGKDQPQRVTRNLQGVKALVLSVDFAHQGRPAGTDPLDVRDEVDFLLPYVKVSLPSCTQAEIQARWCRLPKGWTLTGAVRFARLASEEGWVTAVSPLGAGAKVQHTFTPSPAARTVQMAWRAISKQGGHRIRVEGHLAGKPMRDSAGRNQVDVHGGPSGKVQHTTWNIPAGKVPQPMEVRVHGMPATLTTGWIMQQLETDGPKKIASPDKKLRK